MTQVVFKRRGLYARMAGWFDKLGPCGNIGLIIGIIAGGLISLLSMKTVHLRPTPWDVFWIVVILSIFCWLVMLFISAAFLRLQMRPVIAGMLMRSVVICLFTVLICYYSGAYRLGIFIGILVGLLFGFILCWMLKYRRG